MRDVEKIPDLDLMVRGEVRGWTNLSIGEPVFLQKEMALLYPDVGFLSSPRYPSLRGERWFTIECIKTLFPVFKSFKDDNFVFTNGGKQALSAAMFAAKKIGYVEVRAEEPYWLSLPTLAAQVGMGWNRDTNISADIITYPNNPDGIHTTGLKRIPENGEGDFRILDAVYDSYVYNPNPHSIECDAAVGSFSKAFGLSGLRFGWAAFKDDADACSAVEYLETTTSGVSSLVESYALQFLTNIEEHHDAYIEAQTKARNTLLRSGAVFMEEMGHHCDIIRGLPAGEGGMFAWFKPSRSSSKFTAALVEARTTMVSGKGFCMPGSPYADYFRANLGADPREVQAALSQLNTALSK